MLTENLIQLAGFNTKIIRFIIVSWADLYLYIGIPYFMRHPSFSSRWCEKTHYSPTSHCSSFIPSPNL